ncbi:Agd3-related carbohydrate deacetylase [Deinococcus wulumuqiensis]
MTHRRAPAALSAPLSAPLSALTLALVLTACGQGTQPPTTADAPPSPAVIDEVTVVRAPAEATALPDPRRSALLQAESADAPAARARLGTAYVPQGQRLSAQTLPAGAQTNRVALKVLVLSSGEGDFGLPEARNMLGESGVPYDVFDASTQPLTMDTLVREDGVGRYQGVILTSSALLMQPDSAGLVPSALDSAEWETLFEYERAYRVRQLALYGSPGTVPEDYGLRAVAGAETTTTSMKPTAAGRGVLSDLTGTVIPVRYAYTYPSAVTSVPGVSTTPLLTDPSGRVLGATSTSSDGRERLILTMAQNPALRHSQLLSYGLVGWLTRGVSLGEHRRFLQVDIDDWFLGGDHYNASTGQLYADPFRISGNDALAVRDQQGWIRSSFPVARNFRYAMAFNGGGARTDVATLCTTLFTGFAKDSLSSASKCLGDTFDWVNHTKDHLRMDVMDYATANSQLADNFVIGSRMGLNMSRNSLVTGEHSGLGNMDPTDDGTYNDSDVNLPKTDLGLERSNVNLLSAATNNGIRYLASDHSVKSHWDASCPTCGVPHPLNAGVFLVPRWPNGVAYHVTTPTEATAFFNSVYGPQGRFPYFPSNLTYTEFLDYESDVALNHVLDGGAFPHYMHQPNLREYSWGKSLASDWIRALLTKYSKYTTLPLSTLRWDDLGPYVERRTQEEKAKAAGLLTGVYDRASNTVTLQSAAPLPYTLSGGNSGTPYGAQRIQKGTVSGTLTVAVTPR